MSDEIKRLADELAGDDELGSNLKSQAEDIKKQAEHTEISLSPGDTGKYDRLARGASQIASSLGKLRKHIANTDNSQYIAETRASELELDKKMSDTNLTTKERRKILADYSRNIVDKYKEASKDLSDKDLASSTLARLQDRTARNELQYNLRLLKEDKNNSTMNIAMVTEEHSAAEYHNPESSDSMARTDVIKELIINHTDNKDEQKKILRTYVRNMLHAKVKRYISDGNFTRLNAIVADKNQRKLLSVSMLDSINRLKDSAASPVKFDTLVDGSRKAAIQTGQFERYKANLDKYSEVNPEGVARERKFIDRIQREVNAAQKNTGVGVIADGKIDDIAKGFYPHDIEKQQKIVKHLKAHNDFASNDPVAALQNRMGYEDFNRLPEEKRLKLTGGRRFTNAQNDFRFKLYQQALTDDVARQALIDDKRNYQGDYDEEVAREVLDYGRIKTRESKGEELKDATLGLALGVSSFYISEEEKKDDKRITKAHRNGRLKKPDMVIESENDHIIKTHFGDDSTEIINRLKYLAQVEAMDKVRKENPSAPIDKQQILSRKYFATQYEEATASFVKNHIASKVGGIDAPLGLMVSNRIMFDENTEEGVPMRLDKGVIKEIPNADKIAEKHIDSIESDTFFEDNAHLFSEEQIDAYGELPRKLIREQNNFRLVYVDENGEPQTIRDRHGNPILIPKVNFQKKGDDILVSHNRRQGQVNRLVLKDTSQSVKLVANRLDKTGLIPEIHKGTTFNKKEKGIAIMSAMEFDIKDSEGLKEYKNLRNTVEHKFNSKLKELGWSRKEKILKRKHLEMLIIMAKTRGPEFIDTLDIKDISLLASPLHTLATKEEAKMIFKILGSVDTPTTNLVTDKKRLQSDLGDKRAFGGVSGASVRHNLEESL